MRRESEVHSQLQYVIPLLIVVATSCSSLKVASIDDKALTGWPTEGQNVKRTRIVPGRAPSPPLEQMWIYNATAGFSTSSPLIVDNYVVVSTRKGEVHVIDLNGGKKVGVQRFGQSIEGSPVISGQTLFVPNAWGRPFLTAYDLRVGEKLWTWREVPVESSLLLVDDVLVAADVEGGVHAFNTELGYTIWEYTPDTVDPIAAGPVAPSDSRVIVASTSGVVSCLRSDDGTLDWSVALGRPVYSTPAADDNYVYVPTTDGVLVSIDWRTGRQDWTYRASDPLVRLTSPAVDGDLLVFGGTDGVLRAVAKMDGSTKWTFQTDGTFSAPPALQGNFVFAGATDRRFFVLDAGSGALEWDTKLRGRIKSAPALSDGYVIVLSEPRYVYAFAELGHYASQ